MAFFSELGGIGEEVHQDLLHAEPVADDRKLPGRDFRLEQDARFDQRRNHFTAFGEQFREIEGLGSQAQFPGVDTGHVENVADEGKQVFRAFFSVAHQRPLVPVQGGGIHDLDQPDNGIERRSEFMAYGSDEPLLRFQGALQLTGELGEVAVRLFDPVLERITDGCDAVESAGELFVLPGQLPKLRGKRGVTMRGTGHDPAGPLDNALLGIVSLCRPVS